MGLDFVERFFKLTLDNVYRFACSVLFVVALVACNRKESPIAQLGDLLDYLAIPSRWLAPVEGWIAQRWLVVGGVAVLALFVAIAFAAAHDWRSRSGSTALLSVVVLIQVGQGRWILPTVAGIIVGLALLTGFATFLANRFSWDRPEWTRTAWEQVTNVLISLALAALYLLSPVGWLISQESYNVRGSRWNPLYIERVERSGPTGAVRLR